MHQFNFIRTLLTGTCTALLLQSASPVRAQVSYAPLFDNAGFSKTIDQSRPVGTIQGSANVTLNGGATYAIPVKCPPGTNGQVPQISINYNSQAPDGVLGRGWTVTGLSVITRGGKDIYHDGVTAPVSYTNGDFFMLDGNRLAVVSGTNGANGATYRTEMENYAVTTSYGTGSGPQYFRVVSKNGTIYEYGNTADSRTMSDDNSVVMNWRLNKIQDANGNYVEFIYSNFDRDYCISRIRYTGNANTGLAPYNTIDFSYLQRDDKNTAYDGGYTLKRNMLLSQIQVQAEGSAFKTWQFSYGKSTAGISQLRTVEEVAGDGSKLNDTRFLYGAPGTAGSTVTSNTDADIMDPNQIAYAGDFNGDGYSDMVVSTTAMDNTVGVLYSTGFKVKLFDPATNSYRTTETKSLASGYSNINQIPYITTNNLTPGSDVNGDGIEDIIMSNTYTSTNGRALNNVSIFYMNKTGNIAKTETWGTPGLYSVIDPAHYFYTGDFNGDGKTDYLTVLSNSTGYNLFFSSPGTGVINQQVSIPSAGATCYYCASPIFPGADKVAVLNMDGDAKADLMLTRGSTTSFYTFSFSAAGVSMDLVNTAAYPTSKDNCYFGDFNGDGKTDILSGPKRSQNSNTANWTLGYSNGKSFDKKPFVFDHVIKAQETYTTGDNTDNIVIGDFNGDGRSDIYDMYFYSISSPEHHVYYSSGTQFSLQKMPATIGSGFYIGDYNGDGRSDLLINGYYNSMFTYFQPLEQSLLLQKVTDGFNRSSSFSYAPLSRNSDYTPGTGETYPVNNLTCPLYVATAISQPDGIGGNNTVSFKYENLRLHRAGKGLLGFEKVSALNTATGIRTENISWINRDFYVPYAAFTKTFLNSSGLQLNQTDNTLSFNRIGSGYCFTQQLTKAINRDFQLGLTLTTDNSYDDWGNTTNSTTVTTGGPEVFTHIQASTFISTPSGPAPYQPSTVILKDQRGSHDELSTKSTYLYDAAGNITEAKTYPNAAKSAYVKHANTYDPYGNLTYTQKSTNTSTAADQPATGYEYDSKGRFVSSETNSLGDKKYIITDKCWGLPTVTTGFNGLTTNYTYNNWGKLLSATIPTGSSASYTVNYSYGWDISGNQLYYSLQEDSSGPDTKRWFDIAGRKVKEQREAFGGKWTTARTTYDARGNIASTTNSFLPAETPMVTVNTYDELNRPSAISNTSGTTSYSYSLAAGLTTTTITRPDGRAKQIVTDASGKVQQSTHETAGAVFFSYDSHGNEIRCQAGNSSAACIDMISRTYDDNGQLSSETDQDAGTTTYKYDLYGRLVSKTDAAGKTSSWLYDISSRPIQKKTDGYTTTYRYFNKDKDYRIQEMSVNSTISDTYDYTTGGNVIRHRKDLGARYVEKTFGYDKYNRLLTTKYFNSGLQTRNQYDANGFLQQVSTDMSGAPVQRLYTVLERNGMGKVTRFQRADGQISQIGYTNTFATNFTTPGVMDLELTYDESNGNLVFRTENMTRTYEEFTYDPADRLTKADPFMNTYMGMTHWGPLEMTYDSRISYSLGAIKSKSDVGMYGYGTFPANAVASIIPGASTVISHETQDITYTPFNKVKGITEMISGIPYEDQYIYDAGEARVFRTQKQGGLLKREHMYMEDYELDIDYSSGKPDVHNLHYINCGDGMNCVVVNSGGLFEYYSTYTDNLGSIVALTDEKGNVVAQQNYDAWGRERNPYTWNYDMTGVHAKPNWLNRGYTGHEMLPEYGLINMNGRLYDPANGRMLRPDNYIQDRLNTQNYNRYSYCLNNPLKYTDPSGNLYLWDDAIVFGTGFLVSDIAYALNTHRSPLDKKSLTAGLLGGAIAEGSYLTLGGGSAEVAATATSNTITAGTAIGNSLEFASAYAFSAAANYMGAGSQIAHAQGWDGVWLSAGYALAAGVSAGMSQSGRGISATLDDAFNVGFPYAGIASSSLGTGLSTFATDLFSSYNTDQRRFEFSLSDQSLWNDVGSSVLTQAASTWFGNHLGNLGNFASKDQSFKRHFMKEFGANFANQVIGNLFQGSNITSQSGMNFSNSTVDGAIDLLETFLK